MFSAPAEELVDEEKKGGGFSAPADEVTTAPSKGASFWRGLRQGATLGFADEIGGGVGATADALAAKIGGDPNPESFADAYRRERDAERTTDAEARAANPKTFGGGELTGGAVTAFAPGLEVAEGAGPLAAAGKIALSGALSGEGASKSDLTKGDVLGNVLDSVLGGTVALGTAGAIHGLGVIGKKLLSSEYWQDIAQNRATKALGYTKRFLKTDAAREGAKKAGQEMLDRGVIEPLASGEDMAGNVQDLIDRSGKDIGDFLKAKGKGFETQSAVQALNQLRPKNAEGQWLTGGAYDKVNQAIDTAIDTVRAHGDVIPFQEANHLKGFLQDLVNWNSNRAEAATGKGIARAMRGAVDTSLENISEGGAANDAFRKFMKDKATYKAAQEVQDALANRLSSEFGNKSVGLTDTIVGAGELARGNPVGAAAAVGGKRAIERYGNQTTAFWANKAAMTLDKMESVLAKKPEFFGSYAPLLLSAAARGTQTLAAVHIILQQKEPSYRQKIGSLDGSVSDSAPTLEREPESQGLPLAPAWNKAEAEPLPPRNAMPALPPDRIAYDEGLEKYLKGDFKGAAEAWHKALKINPKDEEAEMGLKRLEGKR